MIVYLEGKIQYCSEDYAVLLTHGVGYQVFIPRPHLEKLSQTASEIALYVHSIYREDAQQLYGFLDPEEKKLFMQLLQVNSIGPKLALGILSNIGAEELIDAIRFEEVARLTAIPGIGKRSAERLIVDLKDKVGLILKLGSKNQNQDKKTLNPQKILSSEAMSALVNLGYSEQEAEAALKQIPGFSGLSLEELVKQGLKALS